MLSRCLSCLARLVRLALVGEASWFFRSLKRLLTGVAESISTLVLTPCTDDLAHQPLVAGLLLFGESLLRKLCDSSMTTRS